MTSLGLGNPPVPHGKLTAPDTDPVPRPVMLWIGIADSVLVSMRDRLPRATQAMLNCCDEGFKHVLQADGERVEVRRIRYDRKAIGYGIVVAQWQTIAAKAVIPDYLSAKVGPARTVLQSLGLVSRVHLTDRPV